MTDSVNRIPSSAPPPVEMPQAGSRRDIAWWATVLDTATMVFVFAALRVIATGGVRFRMGDVRFSMMDWWRPALVAVVICTIRHAVARRRPLHLRLSGGLRRWWRQASVQAVWPAWLSSRLLVVLAGFVAVTMIGFPKQPAWRISTNELINLPARWDGGWYLSIAASGYVPDADIRYQSALAFFPGLPLAIRSTAGLLGCQQPYAAMLLLTVAFFWGLTYVYRLARLHLNEEQAGAAVALLAFYPFAVCYSAILTESLFLLVAAGACWHLLRREYLPAAAFGLAAGLTRPNGLLLAAPLGLLALDDVLKGLLTRPRPGMGELLDRMRRATVPLAVAAMPVVGLVLYAAYVGNLTGDPFAWAKAQQAWHRKFGEIYFVFLDRGRIIAFNGLYHFLTEHTVELLEFAAGFGALGLSWSIGRRLGLAYGVFVAVCVLPPLVSGGAESVGRYTAPLFPIFIWLAGAVPARQRGFWLAVFAGLQTLVAALFFTWRPPF